MMDHNLGFLSHDEHEAILEMRDAKLTAHDASHMSRLMIALLRSNELDTCTDSAEWLAQTLAKTIDRLGEHIEGACAQ